MGCDTLNYRFMDAVLDSLDKMELFTVVPLEGLEEANKCLNPRCVRGLIVEETQLGSYRGSSRFFQQSGDSESPRSPAC